jgi:hypothetical protein
VAPEAPDQDGPEWLLALFSLWWLVAVAPGCSQRVRGRRSRPGGATSRSDDGRHRLIQVGGHLPHAALPRQPLGKYGKRATPSLIVSKGLLQAVRREAVQAVAHWWGITAQTVTAWRKALHIGGQPTRGTLRLKVEHGKDRALDVLPPAVAKARDPERCRKLGSAHRGRPMPEHVREALRQGRNRRGLAHAAGMPWSAQDDELMRTLPPAEAAKRTGRTLGVISSRRYELHLPRGRRG